MPKRKAIVESSEDSDLSPPPQNLGDAPAEVKGQVELRATKKRKVAAVATTTRKKAVKVEVVEKEEEEQSAESAKKSKRARKVKAEEEIGEEPVPAEKAAAPKKRKTTKKEVKTQEQVLEPNEAGEDKPKKAVRKRKTKEEKEAEAMPLAARTVGHKLFIGAHVSSAGGVQNATSNAVHIGANSFALFLKSQRKWANPPLLPETATLFHGNCEKHSYDQGKHVVPHGSYLVNLAHTDATRTEQAYTSFLDDLKRCESLGIKLYNFHPGVANSTAGDRGKAIAHLASNINRAHAATSTVITLLENMAAGGNVLGSTFEDLRDVIALVEAKDRVGVCLDTCHAFAAGYDLRSPEAFRATMEEFEKVVGRKYLRAVHMNDSKAPFGSHRDLHANIGTGFLGLRAFHNLVNDERFAGLPLVLETPITVTDADGVVLKDEKGKEKQDRGVDASEIKLLESLVGMDAQGEEFKELETKTARKGEPERRKVEQQIERKKEKGIAKGKEKEDKGIWAGEIKLLESLVGMDVDGDEFKEAEARLARKGEPERKRLEEQIERKRQKEAGKKAKGKKKTKGEESELSSLESEVEE